MTNDIFFSVTICCYNSGKYLRETIDSIISQTYTNWEIIAVNDGSSDNTEEIIFDYIHQGIPITYFKQENKGFASARNKAMELAKGDWIAIIDHDDICLLNRLQIQAKHIRENPNAKLFFGNTIHFKDDGVEIRRQFDVINPDGLDWSAGKAMNNFLIYGCFMASSVVVYSKKAALSIGGFNTKYKYVLDADFFKRMGSKYDMHAGKETLAKWRVHANQTTQRVGNIMFEEGKQMFSKYFWFNGVSNRARFALIIHLLKSYLKLLLIKIRLLS